MTGPKGQKPKQSKELTTVDQTPTSLDQLPSREAAREWLQELFRLLHEREKQVSGDLLEYIRGCTDWTFDHARKGLSNYHYSIETTALLPDGSATHIIVMHEFPIDKISRDARQAWLQELMKIAAEKSNNADRPECTEAMYKYIIEQSTTAVVEHITPEGMELLRQYAGEEVDTDQLIKHHRLYWDGAGIEYGSHEWFERRELEQKHVEYRGLNLQGKTYQLDVDNMLAMAAWVSTEKLAELIVHWQEYRTLVGRLTDKGISQEEGERIMRRLDEILNGRLPEDVITLGWQLERELYNPDRWDITVIKSLYELLGGSDQPHTCSSAELELYLSNVRIAGDVSRGLQELESGTSGTALGRSSLNQLLWQ